MVTAPSSRREGHRMSKWNYVKLINVEPTDQMRRGSTGEKPNCKWKLTQVRRSGQCFTQPHFRSATCAKDFNPAL
jgi:hypothetical protein